MMIKKILAIIFGSLLLISCSSNNDENQVDSNFVIIEHDTKCNVFIVYDRETMVEYAISQPGYNSGDVTLLVDSTGKPKLYKGNVEPKYR